MKISITCEKEGWIYYRCAEELKNRLKKHQVFINEEIGDAHIYYYIDMHFFKIPSSAIDVGWFTHFSTSDIEAWMRKAHELDFCIAQSEFSKNALISRGLSEEKIAVIGPGPDASFVPKVRLGLVGRQYLDGRKGEHLVTALVEDEEVSEMVSIVAKHEGWGVPVNDLDYHDFYNSLDFLLIPATVEGGPMPFVEALACGKLAIAPPIGYVPHFEHIEYKTGEFDDLKRVILEVCTPIYEERCERAKQVKEYDWQRWATEHEKLFEKLLVECPKPQDNDPMSSYPHMEVLNERFAQVKALNERFAQVNEKFIEVFYHLETGNARVWEKITENHEYCSEQLANLERDMRNLEAVVGNLLKGHPLKIITRKIKGIFKR